MAVPPVPAAGGAVVGELLPGFGEALCDDVGDAVDDFGLAEADADAPLRSAQLGVAGDAVRGGAVVVAGALELAGAELLDCEPSVLGLVGGLVVAVDEFTVLDRPAGVEVTAGLDVFGAALEDDTEEPAVGTHDGPADGCRLGAGVA